MSNKLQSLLTNPFLRQNPFHSHQSFSHNAQNISYTKQYKQNSMQDYKYLTIQNNNKALQKRNSLNNPFYRKNLIKINQELDYDYVEINRIRVQEGCKKSQLLGQSKRNTSNNLKSYQDLSYKAPPSSSVKYINLQPRPSSLQKYSVSQKQNYPQKITAIISPRFPSTKNLQSIIKNYQIPPLYYKPSIKNIETPTKDPLLQQNIRSKSKRDSRQCSPNQQLSHRRCSIVNQSQKDIPVKFTDHEENTQKTKNYPEHIMIKGVKFYKNYVDNIYKY